MPNTDPEPTSINAQNRLGRFINFRWRHSHPVAASAPVSSPPGEIAKPEVSIHSAQLDVALDIAVRAAAQNTGANAVAIALMQRGQLVCRARLGDIAPGLGVALNVSTGITGACVRTAQILNCADTQTDVRVDAEVCRILGIRSILVIPIFVDGAVAGILEVLSVRAGAFDPLHVEWLQKVAAFVHELAFGKATIAAFDKSSVTEPPSLSSSPGGSAQLPSSQDSPEADSESLDDDPGLTAFRGALEKIGPATSWEDISQELLSRLQK